MASEPGIVVAVDFSETAADTVRAALELARGEQERLHLLHVALDVFRTFGAGAAPGIDWAEVQRRGIDQARDRLLELAVACALDPRRITIAVEVGPPAAEIVKYANAHAAHVVVLGSHGHGVVQRFVLGSVADRVLRQASCLVLLVPHRALGLASARTAATADGGRPAMR